MTPPPSWDEGTSPSEWGGDCGPCSSPTPCPHSALRIGGNHDALPPRRRRRACHRTVPARGGECPIHGLPEPSADPGHPFPGGRSLRRVRPPPGAGHGEPARPVGGRREQERRGGRHRCRLRRQGGQRRARHGHDERLGRRHHAAPDAEDALRSTKGYRATHPHGARAGNTGGERQARYQRLQGLPRGGESQAGQADLRLGRHRRHHAPGDRAAEASGRHRHPARAVSRRRARDQRPDRRHRRFDAARHLRLARAHPGRHGQGAGRHLRYPLRRCCPTCRPCASSACPRSTPTTGTR